MRIMSFFVSLSLSLSLFITIRLSRSLAWMLGTLLCHSYLLSMGEKKKDIEKSRIVRLTSFPFPSLFVRFCVCLCYARNACISLTYLQYIFRDKKLSHFSEYEL